MRRLGIALIAALFSCAWFGASSALAATAQTITFPPPPVSPELVSDTWTPGPTSDSNLTVAVTLDGSSTGCSLAGGLVTFTAPGTCIVDANQPGNGTYAPAAQVQQVVSVTKKPQTISFPAPP